MLVTAVANWYGGARMVADKIEPLMVPDKRRAGQTFAAWKRQLEDLGYKVEHQVLDAADYARVGKGAA